MGILYSRSRYIFVTPEERLPCCHNTIIVSRGESQYLNECNITLQLIVTHNSNPHIFTQPYFLPHYTSHTSHNVVLQSLHD